jgi:hypothetical protein
MGSTVALATNDPNSGQVIVAPGDQFNRVSSPSIDLRAVQPGAPGGGSALAASSGGSGPVCTYQRMDYPVANLFAGIGPLNMGSLGGDGQAAYMVTCDGVQRGWVTGPSQPGSGAAPVAPSPGQLAEQAFEQLQLPLPVPRRSPDVDLVDGRAATVLGEHVWLWVDRSVWAPQTKRVQAGGVWAEVTATPTVLSFDSGMGSSITCPGPGTAYNPSFGLHAASPDCGFVYTHSSAGMANEETTATYAISWQVTWRGGIGAAPAGGTLPVMVSRATDTFAVAEVQALRSG